MMEDMQSLQFEVPGADIIARFQERAVKARAAEAEHAEQSDPCNQGIVERARRDALQFELSAKYLDSGKTYVLNVNQLDTIFLEVDHYADSGLLTPATTAASRW